MMCNPEQKKRCTVPEIVRQMTSAVAPLSGKSTYRRDMVLADLERECSVCLLRDTVDYGPECAIFEN